MQSTRTRLALLLVLALIFAGGLPARADDNDDHEEARRAVQSGQALPLAEILRRLDGSLGGDIIEVEFDEEHGHYVYEFTVITPSGRLLEIEVDALSARILEIDD
jgi:uncharacterized membrane protein YkoI